MGKKKKKKKQAERAAEEKEEKEEEDFNQMLKEFKQDDADQGRHAEAPPPAAAVCTRSPFHLCRHPATILVSLSPRRHLTLPPSRRRRERGARRSVESEWIPRCSWKLPGPGIWRESSSWRGTGHP